MIHTLKPAVIGASMGAMMLWMLHGILTGQSSLAGPALVMFVGAHVLVVVLLLLAAFGLARLSPKVQRILQRVHRPSLTHIFTMVVGAITVAGAIHVLLHGFG